MDFWRECYGRFKDTSTVYRVFCERGKKDLFDIISRTDFIVEGLKVPMAISCFLVAFFKEEIIKLLRGLKDESRVGAEYQLVGDLETAIKDLPHYDSAVGRIRHLTADDRLQVKDAFERRVITYVETFIQFNEESFKPSFLLEREDFPSKMSGKDAPDCVKVLKDLLEKYPSCEEGIKEKFLETKLDQGVKEQVLTVKGWSTANRGGVFSGQGIMIGGSDLDNKQSADSKEDIENLKKQNRDLHGENAALKQLLEEKKCNH